MRWSKFEISLDPAVAVPPITTSALLIFSFISIEVHPQRFLGKISFLQRFEDRFQFRHRLRLETADVRQYVTRLDFVPIAGASGGDVADIKASNSIGRWVLRPRAVHERDARRPPFKSHFAVAFHFNAN